MLLLALFSACTPGKPPVGDDPATDSGQDDSGGDSATDSGEDSGGDSDDSGADTGDCFELPDGSCVVETWVDLPELEADAEGVHTLTFGPTEIVLRGDRHCGRAYNGVYPGPTLVTEARSGETQRQVRVDLHNTFSDHDYRSLDGDATCACTDGAGEECLPHGHGGCDEEAPDDCTCANDEGEACEHMYDFNLTNLHAHGSHVRPDHATGGGCEEDGDLLCRDCDADACDDDPSDDTCFYADDVLTEVHPATGARYRWDVDEDGTHHDGLNWYHPHIHGTTAIQVASGAAGAWVIRGDVDEVDGLADARERVMVFTTPPIGDGGFVPLADDEACTEETLTFNDFSVLGSVQAKQANLLNGVEAPRMVTPPGQVERWRLLSASFLDESWFGIFRGGDSDCSTWAIDDPLTLTQYARDGITLPETFAAPYFFLSSGYRVEGWLGGEGVLQDGDTWCFVAGRFLQEGDDGTPQSPGEAPSGDDVEELLSLGSLVGILNVTASAGTATETTPPTEAALAAVAPATEIDGVSAADLCAEAAEVEGAEQIDQAAILQVGATTADDPDPCECDNYNVNCRNFGDVDRDVYPYDRDLPLGETEHWRVAAARDGHPFHIHINPFLVCPDDNPFDPIPVPHWRDTFLVNLDRKVDLVTQYRAFTGAYVFHCHKLTHEDEGMMQVLRVCDPATDPTCGTYDWRHCEDDDLECIQALAATDCALESDGTAETFACITALGGPGGVCGEDACGSDDDCSFPARCRDNVCAP